MRRDIFRAGFVLAAIGAVVPAIVAPAFASPAAAATHLAADTPSAISAVTGVWTAEAMRSAIPIERLVEVPKTAPAEVERGLPSMVRPSSFLDTGKAWAGGGDVKKTAGRVFFTFQGRKASCSGDAVTSTNKSVVVTAGHCVKFEGSWHTDWIFVPGYDNGNAPF